MDRNVLIAIALSMAVLIGWEIAVVGPQREALEAQREAQEARQAAEAAAGGGAQTSPGAAGPRGLAPPPVAAGPTPVAVEDALAAAPRRVRVDTPALAGSINLAGARLDDLRLKNYREELDPESPTIRLLSPAATEHGHYIEQGWNVGAASTFGAPWTLVSGETLTPETPVTLSRTVDGVRIERVVAVDENFMFAATDTLTNDTGDPRTVVSWGLVDQRGIPEDLKNFMILHEGPIAIVDDSKFERKYDKARTAVVEKTGGRGWVGITNKYWLAAAVPPQDASFEAKIYNIGKPEAPVFRAGYTMAAATLAPGESRTTTFHLFGGAKDVGILQAYEKSPEKGGLGVWDFDKAVDWGNFFILTRPIFYTLDFFGDLTGNFGVAILLLTLVIKALLFPLANKAYESMSKMKKLQPEVKKLQDRYKDDKMKLQQEMMGLYQKEKLNPLAGCLPILIQMPIFYALYKTLFVTIELRHEPFVGWIRDLSAPDPTSIFNLFGILPYDPTALPLIGAFLGVGVLPLLMGAAMWFQTKLNPPAADPIQQQIFTMMPILFTFLFASFAAGLVLYWFWNTALSILQQWAIMKKNGVEIDWGERLPFLKGGAKSPAPGE
ncbi:MAG: membrane protein insertase YidC [Parvularculaceae bacterium]